MRTNLRIQLTKFVNLFLLVTLFLYKNQHVLVCDIRIKIVLKHILVVKEISK